MRKPFFTEEELEEIRKADKEMGFRPQRKEVKPKPPAVKEVNPKPPTVKVERSPEEIREIRREYRRRYQAKHREEILERRRRYYEKNRDKIRAYNRTYYFTHKDKYNGTPESRARALKYRNSHREEINARHRMPEWQKARNKAERRIKKIDEIMAALTTEREALMKEMEAER